MSRPTSTTFAPHRARLVRALDQISGALAARLLDQVLVGQREHGNRLRVLAAELQDTRRSIHLRFDHLENTVSELTTATGDLRSAVQGLSDRIGPAFATIEQLTQTLTDERLADQIEDDSFRAEITGLRDEATSAVASVRGDIDTLNALGAQQVEPAPEQPTEETPATPVEDEPATVEDAPAEQSGDARL